MKTSTFAIVASALLVSASQAALITSGSLTFSEDFNSFTGAGYNPPASVTAGQLATDTWAADGVSGGSGVGGGVDFGSNAVSGNYARGTQSLAASNGTSGIYAFDQDAGPGTNYAFGALPSSGNFQPGNFYLNLQNSTGSTLTTFDLSYDIFTWDRAARSNTFNLSYTVATIVTMAGSGTDPSTLTYTSVPTLNYASPEGTETNTYISTPRSTTLTGLTVANGQSLVLRWTTQDTGSATGPNRDAVGLDNVVVTAVPEPTTIGLFFAAGIVLLTAMRSRRQSA